MLDSTATRLGHFFLPRTGLPIYDIFDRHASDAIGQATTRLAAGYPIDFEVGTLIFYIFLRLTRRYN